MSVRKGGAHDVFACWGQISRRLRAAKRIPVFLDFDGTLVAFRTRPEDVSLNPATRWVLRRLARHPRVILVIVSGRRRDELIQRVKVAQAKYLGLYGWESRNGLLPPRKPGHAILRAKHLLTPLVRKLPRIWMEDKKVSLAVHYRNAPTGSVRRARRAVRQVVRRFESELRMLEGNKLWEIVPFQVRGKGEAVRRVLATMPRPCLPIYVGDDQQDESAFAILRWGITVRVGNARRSRARYRLANSNQVRLFLERLARDLS